jgi:hypothetical protein
VGVDWAAASSLGSSWRQLTSLPRQRLQTLGLQTLGQQTLGSPVQCAPVQPLLPGVIFLTLLPVAEWRRFWPHTCPGPGTGACGLERRRRLSSVLLRLLLQLLLLILLLLLLLRREQGDLLLLLLLLLLLGLSDRRHSARARASGTARRRG